LRFSNTGSNIRIETGIKKVIINPSEIDYLAKNGEIISVINQGNKLEVELQLRDNLIPVFESSNILIEDVDDT